MVKKKLPNRAGLVDAGKSAVRPQNGVVAVPIDRSFPEGQVGILSNHFVIQRDGPEFHLLFFQTHPPIVLAQTDDECRELLEGARAKSVCVARVIVSAERLPSFIQAMQENLERYGRQQENAQPADLSERGAR